MLSPLERRELEKPASSGPSVYADLLSLRYPAYKERIAKARAAGYTDDQIAPRLQEREAKALLYYPAQQVNERIGRTPETINSVELYERRRMRDSYVKAYEGKLTEQEVDERLTAAELIDVQAPLLLQDDELYKKLAGHIKMREGWFEAAYNGAVRDRLNRDESSLGMRLIYGEESEDLWKQLDELDGLQQQYMPAKDPSFSGSVKRGVGGAVEVLAQYVKGGIRGATTYGPSMAAAGASTAAIMRAPAFSNPLTAPAAAASIVSGGVTGFGLGVAMGASMENFEREAGGAMVEYARMKDEQGQPMDRNAARVAAILTGAVNAGLEHFQLSTFLESLPGGERLVKFLGRSGMKKLLAVPTIRSALAEVGKKYIGGIATESIQEMAQETMTILGGELGKIFSGQEFAGLNLEESIDRVLETGAQTVGTMAVSFLPGTAMRAYGGVRQARASRGPIQGHAVDGLGENVSTQDTAPDIASRAADGLGENVPVEEEGPVQGQPVDTEDIDIYIPVAALEQYNQTHPGELENLGIDLVPIDGTSEVRMTEAQFVSLSEELPDLAEAVKNEVRRGAKGMTTKEVGELLIKKLESPKWRTPETDAIAKELEQKMLGVGKDKEEARLFGKLGASFSGVMSNLTGVSASDFAKMEFRRGEEVQVEGEGYEQSAYHGSPHRGIKKMSLQHIGTGEGNQVFGYGIYSAQARDTAESYREALTKGRADAREHVVFSNERGEYSYKDGAWIGPDGEKVSPAGERILTSIAEERIYSSAPLRNAVARYKEIAVEDLAWGERDTSDYRQEIAKLEEEGKAESDRHDELKDKLSHALNLMESWKQDLEWLNANPLENEVITPNDGQLYRLEVPENDVLLDWDKPISEQPEKVKAAIQEIAEELTPEDLKQLGGNTDMFLFEGMTGRQFYAMLAWLPSVGSEKDVSLLLGKHGVPGLRYLDALSRSKGEGTHNFVIWDEDAMQIMETYYQRQSPLAFKLTGKPVSEGYMAALEKLEAGESVAAEEYDAIPEIQDARGRTATGSTLNMPGREAIRQQVYDRLMSYGSAVTEVVDGQKQTVYNGEVRNDRRADIIIGLPASGKSSALVNPISSKYKSMLIDSDEAKKLIPEFDDGFGAGYVHEESKRIVADVTEAVTDEGRNVVIPIVGSGYAKLKKRYIDDLRQKGYKVYVHMADINPNVAAGRNLRRFAETGRFVDLAATSFKYGTEPLEVFERVKKEGIADGYSRIDTTVFPGRWVEGTEDISHDRGDLRKGRRSVLGEDPGNQGRESSQAGAAGGGRRTAEELSAKRAGGTSREGTAPRSVSAPNARLTVQPDGVSLIEFFENANRSTSFHEFAHHMFRMLDEVSRMEGAKPELMGYVDTILQEAGVVREEFDSDDVEVRKRARTQAHEFFARGFEAYLAEGKAPSKQLRSVFRKLRAWLIEVYRDVVQALGIELSPEMRDIYARLLATPEEITAETTVQELAIEEAAIKEELKRQEQEARERANEVKTAYREGVKAGRDEATLKARERQKLLRAKLQERQALKKEVKKLVGGINKMARSETISWAMHKQIEKLLSSYDLKKRNKETMERRAELEEYLKAHPEAGDTMNAADLKHLGKTTLGNMKLEELRSLHEQVAQLYDRGKEEYKVWDLERAERRDTMQAELRKALEKKKVDLPQVAKRPEDLKKQYKGVTGKLAKAKDWVYAATLNPDRFFDWMDGGRTGYKGPFVRYFVDLVNKQRDEALRHIYERRTWMEKGLRELGFRMSDFARVATELNGTRYTWSEIMEIYIGMRNDKKARAILYGNFKNTANPEGDVAHLISLLTEDHKRAAELVVQDHNRNVDRIEAGMIQAFQKGMDRETDYSSIHRMEHLSSMGLIDAESSEALVDGMADAGVLRRVEDGFMKKRVEMKDENQTPIQLGLFENWHTDVSRHEHAAAMASTARDLASALLSRNPADKQTLGKMVKERFGDEAWRSFTSFFNDSVLDDARLAHNLLDRLTKTVTKNMVIAYLAGNLGTVLKQTTSLPRFLNTAGAHRMLVSIAQFLTQGPKFLEKVYELDPQMRERKGSAILTMLREDPQWGKRMYQRGLDWMLAPIAMADRWVAAIGWKATYDANLKRLGHEGAVREAQRAVRLTQQPASAKDSARMWRQNGFVRLAMVFTSDAAQTFGMTAYDLVQQLRGGKIGKAFMTLTALAMTGILMKAASDGLPSDEDDEDEDRNWVLDAFTEQFISSIPLVGKEAMVLYDNLSGKYRGSQYSAIVAPIEKIARAYRLWTDEDSDEEDFRRATWLALEALSLSGAAPVPVTGVKRVVQSLEMAGEDGTAAALNMVGIRRRPQ